MNMLFIVVAIIAVVLLLTGGFVQSLNFLLWVGVILLVLAVIAFLVRSSCVPCLVAEARKGQRGLKFVSRMVT